MDKSTLNQKVWYRAVKVIFVIAFILVILIGFGIASEFTMGKISYVQCDNGKTFDHNYPFSDEAKLEIYRQCDPSAYFSNRSSQSTLLTENLRQELDKIVIQMTKDNALESDIQKVVDNFKLAHIQPRADSDMNKTYTTEEFSRIAGHDISDSIKVGNSNWILNYKMEYRDEHSVAVKALYYILSSLIVCFIFWIVRRIFFYVFIRERFFRL